MGRALVISNIDFSSVAVDQIEFIDSIPCTDLTLSQSAVSFTKVGETATITAIPTPTDTTDAVTWESSDPNVASVNGGVITIHGIGSATITAKCGAVRKTIEITQTSLINDNVYYLEGRYPSKISTDVPAMALMSLASQRTFGEAYDGSADVMVYENRGLVQAVRVPYGATKVKVHIAESATRLSGYAVFGSTAESVTYSGANYCKWLRQVAGTNIIADNDTEYGECVIFRTENSNNYTLDGVVFS